MTRSRRRAESDHHGRESKTKFGTKSQRQELAGTIWRYAGRVHGGVGHPDYQLVVE